ncbi:hypothetical protein BerOc1_01002 [Pseudodesulfovibrio hydrargyri]|uniref:Uncharacterized protein n=1 Tax=Pseudodesulfovibrio hydrargyri TaxID=2125990 RepID=A0A1J5MSW0_9BACT|nr:hypothetical protein [Pseudodesulfovibrio hydrargyri]OIQ49082.1 hypothetical protein BerOc1_01002 [Pseudodesulfovibrio hydrargyri]
MGLEVGWYLRFALTDRVEAQVALKAAPQVRHQAHVFPDWAFEIEEFEDHALAVMTRRQPVYDKEP